MKQDFQDALKALGKQAKQAAKEKELAERAKKQAGAAEVDFARIIGEVTPLKSSQRYQAPQDKSPIRVREQEHPVLDDADYFYVGAGFQDEPPASFSKNGQGQNDIKRLQNAHWPVVADVDLHGYTQEQAQQVLNEFIEFIKPRGVCGEIIHGSGLGSSGYKPVLKHLVRRWLMAHPDVLAYAEPHPGNDGAVRILIKRPYK